MNSWQTQFPSCFCVIIDICDFLLKDINKQEMNQTKGLTNWDVMRQKACDGDSLNTLTK